MSVFYDRQGNPLDIDGYVAYIEGLKKDGYEDYKRVASAHVGDFWVSTVWLGIDHRFGREGPPLIFETMVFVDEQATDSSIFDHDLYEYTDRYSSEEEALQGHARVVTLLKTMIDIASGALARDGLEGKHEADA